MFNHPYRLYNNDVYRYPTSSSALSLYGSIPLIHAHSADSTVAVFVAAASETWIDVARPTKESTETHWMSESGILDVFLLPGSTPDQVFGQYARLTGAVQLPPHWSLAYHQSRWSYFSSDDIRGVQKRFDEEDIPVDVFWLDIGYSEDFKYMTWDKEHFPDPVDMIKDVEARARKVETFGLIQALQRLTLHRWLSSSTRISSAPRITLFTRKRKNLGCSSRISMKRSSRGSLGATLARGSISSIRTVGNGTRLCTSSTEEQTANGVGLRARILCISGMI